MGVFSKSIILFFVVCLFGYLVTPTVQKLFFDDPASDKELLRKKYEQVKSSYDKLSGYFSSIVDLEKNSIRVVLSDGTLDFDTQSPPVKEILKDIFKLDVVDGRIFLDPKEELPEDVFLSDISGQLNTLFSNVGRIKEIEFLEDVPEIRFYMKEGKRLSANSTPISSMIGDELDFVFNGEGEFYSSQINESEFSLNLGLDLKGGTYLELGIDIEKLLTDSMLGKVQQLRNILVNDEVDFDRVAISEDGSKIELNLYDKELVDLSKNEYFGFLEEMDSNEEEYGYSFSWKDETVETIKIDAIDQSIQTISNRINELGVKEPIIQKKGNNAIIVQLAGVSDPERAVNLIRQSAVLEFRIVENVDSGDDTITLFYKEYDPVTKEVVSESPLTLNSQIAMRGDTISNARVAFDRFNQPYVSLEFNSEGTQLFGSITTNNTKRNLAIILDNEVRSFPTINTPITNGQAQITGSFTVEEARDLALVLRSGSLKAPLVINQQKTIGSSLGEESIEKSLTSMAWGMFALVAFIILIYRFSGVFAFFALVLNIVMVIGMMAYFGATLTLAGIAGLILTIGMAVDANIIIFERVREEMKESDNKKKIIGTAFTRSLNPILDSNITTILAAVVLIEFGKDQIKGFGVTLSVGILCSVFTALFFTKYLMEVFFIRNKNSNISI